MNGCGLCNGNVIYSDVRIRRFKDVNSVELEIINREGDLEHPKVLGSAKILFCPGCGKRL